MRRVVIPAKKYNDWAAVHLDSFPGHGFDLNTGEFSSEMIQFAHANRLALVVIPPGTTPFIQVGDTHIHSAFKASLADQWCEYQVKNAREGKKIESAKIADMREWIAEAVVKAVDEINKPDLIRRAFVENGFVANFNSSDQEAVVRVSKMFLD